MSLLLASVGRDRRPGSRWPVALLWAAVFGVSTVLSILPAARPVWVWLLVAAGLAGWVVRTALPARMSRARLAVDVGLVLCGGLVAFSANIVGGVPLAIGLSSS